MNWSGSLCILDCCTWVVSMNGTLVEALLIHVTSMVRKISWRFNNKVFYGLGSILVTDYVVTTLEPFLLWEVGLPQGRRNRGGRGGQGPPNNL